MDGGMGGWMRAAPTEGPGAAPEGGEDSEGGLCADNKLPSSEEGELGQGHAGPSGQSNCREPSRLSVAAGEPPAAAAESSFHRVLFRDTASPGPFSRQRVWENGAQTLTQKDVSSLPLWKQFKITAAC